MLLVWRILLVKLTVAQLARNFPALLGAQCFATIFAMSLRYNGN